MKKTAKPKRAKDRTPAPTQWDEMTRLVLLGASLYHAGMKQAQPTAPALNAESFTFTEQPKPKARSKEDQLPEV